MPARRLAPVPDQPPRALGLVRVSKERDDMIAPEIQWTAIEDHCRRRGYQLVGRLEGIDESGSQRRSPWWRTLDSAVSQVEQGGVDVLVVWRFSRTARQRLRWAVAIDRVEVAGGLLESATEPLDTSTASGRLARGMLGEMAAYEAEVIGATWREVHARRTRTGRPANGKPRFGYRVVDGLHRPDPDTGPVLAALYRRYVAGESAYALVEWLNRQGYRTVAGYSRRGPGPWTQMAVRRVLDSGFGAGWLTVHGEQVRGVHEPVVDDDVWQRYLAARETRRGKPATERSDYVLSGMLRCMADVDGRPCGSRMGGGRFGSQRTPKFRCLAAVEERRHPGGYVRMTVVEAAVLDWLRGQAGEVDAEGDAARAAARVTDRRKVDADTLAREIVALDQQLTRLTVQLARDLIPEAAYAAARDEITAERAHLEVRHARALLAVRSTVDAGPIVAALLADWDGLLVAERRALLRTLVDRVEVVPVWPLSRVRVVPAWVEGDSR